MNQSQLKVIVAGGGLGGCALALFLSRLGIQVTVLELRAERPEILLGGFLTISPNGTRILGALGLVDKLFARDNGIKIPLLSMYDSGGMFLGNVPQGREERYGFPSILTARWDVHETLLDEAASKGIEVIYGAKVGEVVENDASVTVHWTEGNEKKQAEADLIVGADGIWSSVRNSVYAHMGTVAPKPTYQGLLGVGGVVPVADVPGLEKFLTHALPMAMFHGQNGFFGAALFDKTGTHAGWWSTYESPERAAGGWKTPKEESMSEVVRRQKDWAFPVSEIITAVGEYDFSPYVVPIYEVEGLEHWHTSRIVLIGDAAHATPPHSGQGASQALEDAGYLATLIRQLLLQDEASAPTSEQLRNVLAAFQEGRQSRVNMIIREANRRGNAKKDQSALSMFFKKWAMKIFFTLFMTEGMMDHWFGYEVPGLKEWTSSS